MTVVPGSLHGACTRAAAIERIGRHQVRVALQDGRLVPLWPRTLVERERLADPQTRAASAVLSTGEGAVLVNQTALYLHGCGAARATPIHLRVPYNRWPAGRRGVLLHHGRVDPTDIVEVAGLPVHSLAASLAEVCCTGPRRMALACCDQALGRFTEDMRPRFKDIIAQQLALRLDRRGTLQAERVLSLATGLTESPAESSIMLVIVESGFPPPTPQHTVRSPRGHEIYRLDFAWVNLGIALEYDGYAVHEGREREDAERAEDLQRRGWVVVRASAPDLTDPTRLIAELSEAFRHRLG